MTGDYLQIVDGLVGVIRLAFRTCGIFEDLDYSCLDHPAIRSYLLRDSVGTAAALSSFMPIGSERIGFAPDRLLSRE